jgi:ferritin-like metal-binding protein YciE
MKARDEVIDWLRDAYAMERGMEVTLKKIFDSNNHQPEIREAAARHLEETQKHAETVRTLLQELGADTSTIKTGLGMITEAVKGLTTTLVEDEPVKDLLASYAMEHLEIISYYALAAAAEASGLPKIAETCAKIISEEEAMADILADALPRIVHDYLGSQKFAKAA